MQAKMESFPGFHLQSFITNMDFQITPAFTGHLKRNSAFPRKNSGSKKDCRKDINSLLLLENKLSQNHIEGSSRSNA